MIKSFQNMMLCDKEHHLSQMVGKHLSKRVSETLCRKSKYRSLLTVTTFFSLIPDFPHYITKNFSYNDYNMSKPGCFILCTLYPGW